uniref:hypothetical protein n=1 Tax=Clavibacter michiganensis TaxID=28447 RepID=UPI00292E2A9E
EELQATEPRQQETAPVEDGVAERIDRRTHAVERREEVRGIEPVACYALSPRRGGSEGGAL